MHEDGHSHSCARSLSFCVCLLSRFEPLFLSHSSCSARSRARLPAAHWSSASTSTALNAAWDSTNPPPISPVFDAIFFASGPSAPRSKCKRTAEEPENVRRREVLLSAHTRTRARAIKHAAQGRRGPWRGARTLFGMVASCFKERQRLSGRGAGERREGAGERARRAGQWACALRTARGKACDVRTVRQKRSAQVRDATVIDPLPAMTQVYLCPLQSSLTHAHPSIAHSLGPFKPTL